MPPPRASIPLLHPRCKPSWASPLRVHSRTLSTRTVCTRPQPLNTTSQLFRNRAFLLYFSLSCRMHAREPNYYEILDLQPTATAPQIKKQYYALCLRHHPDHNREDPEANKKFLRLTTAYNTLRNASKRAAYDREHGFHHTLTHSHGHPVGSHSSHTAAHQGSYAGSRPASGLSKRRGTFQGPPPSFYAQGGYGKTGRTGFEGAYTGPSSGESNTGTRKEDDPEDPMGFIYRNPLGHFNARAHFRTQSAEDRRRSERRRAAREAAMKEDDFLRTHGGGHIDFTMLFSILGILLGVCCIGGLATNMPRDSTPSGGVAGALDAAEAARRRKEKERTPPS
ncbi:Heat shock protein DnaJ [Penicillium malachiteum]|uniref:Heat shock protein DnaJ n=1 Tax=Penicillium malachiteum TaxID=1324776 RepID=UPI00254958E1|nr:Heat shock protein DnaJ [Penicillium malachiteum]KAJ5725794.1 Heat shock protein DnaJ [Penicillium malachiteum]